MGIKRRTKDIWFAITTHMIKKPIEVNLFGDTGWIGCRLEDWLWDEVLVAVVFLFSYAYYRVQGQQSAVQENNKQKI